MNVEAVQDLIFREAELLDDWRLDEWLELCSDDVVYWIPAGPHPEHHDPLTQVSIAYDDRQRLEERVARLKSGAAHAQDPVSRVTRLVGGLRVSAISADSCSVRSSFVLFESRLGRAHQYGGRLEHELVAKDGQWLIRRKKVSLVESAAFLPNLAFIL